MRGVAPWLLCAVVGCTSGSGGGATTDAAPGDTHGSVDASSDAAGDTDAAIPEASGDLGTVDAAPPDAAVDTLPADGDAAPLDAAEDAQPDASPADTAETTPGDTAPDTAADIAADTQDTAPGDTTADTADTSAPPITMDNYPRVDGSTSNLPLARVIACELLGVPWTWTTSGESGVEKTVIPDPTPGDPVQDEKALWIVTNIEHHKTHEAAMRLIDDETDLILVASKPSPDELAHAAEVGVTLKWDAVALDALVVLLNQQNPVGALTTAQIQQIYGGTLTSWSEVGGPDEAIHPYARPENSGSQQLFDTLVMQGLPMAEWPPDQVPIFMGGLVDKLKEDPFSIGYSVFYYVTYQYSIGGLKLIAVDGAVPTPQTISDGTFPYVAEVWVVVREDLDPDSLAAQLRAWLLAPGGQAVVAKSGYVPLP